MQLHLQPVRSEDFEALHTLRMAAMRASLERLGRFDPERSRARLADGFEPLQMRHVCGDGARIGFLTLVPEVQALNLKHFYIAPGAQGQGVGGWAMSWVQGHGQDVVLSALKGSDANRFYRRHGFVQTGESDFDIQYRWSALR